MAAPFLLSGVEVEVGVSVGLTCSGPDGQLSELLLEDADTAMYQAKRKGGRRHQIVDAHELGQTAQRTRLLRDLRGALGRGELRAEYQPIVGTADGRIVGAEALLRWDHPSRGVIGPAVLVPLAEQSGLINEIGLWVLERACADLGGWRSHGHGVDLTASVNVSVTQLMSPGFAATVATSLAAAGTDPASVILEVTESVFIQDSERALAVLGELKQIGLRIALDDFGTGYSALGYLKRFPIDIVKIDQGFVADLASDRVSLTIVRVLVELAHLLDMTVVAEGVETSEQHDQLASMGCDRCQGFHFAQPMSARELSGLLRQDPEEGDAGRAGQDSTGSIASSTSSSPAVAKPIAASPMP